MGDIIKMNVSGKRFFSSTKDSACDDGIKMTVITVGEKTCSVLSKNKCKKRKEECLFSKKEKNEKPCSVKKDKYNHECKQYEDKKACIAVQYCSYSKKTCSHKCDTTKKKCKKERKGVDGRKICNYEKYQPCANECCGCCKL